MLNELKRFFKAADAVQPEEGNVAMTTKDEQLAAADDKSAELLAQLTTATEALTAKETALADLTAKFEQAQSALAEIEKAKQELIVKAKEEKLAARKAKVEAAIGTAKADEILKATESLEDASFDSLLSAFSVSLDAEAKSKMFVEAGVVTDGSDPEATAEAKPVHFNTFIKKD